LATSQSGYRQKPEWPTGRSHSDPRLDHGLGIYGAEAGCTLPRHLRAWQALARQALDSLDRQHLPHRQTAHHRTGSCGYSVHTACWSTYRFPLFRYRRLDEVTSARLSRSVAAGLTGVIPGERVCPTKNSDDPKHDDVRRRLPPFRMLRRLRLRIRSRLKRSK
jgi:hypothetical protein